MSDRDTITLPRELAEKALEALEHFKLVFGGYSEEVKALRTALAAEQPVAKAWAEGYQQGVKDERTSEASIGIAGFGAKVEPARQNPYGTALAAEQPKPEPVAWRPRLSPNLCFHWSRPWSEGVPSEQTVDYWNQKGAGVEYAYAAPPEDEALRRDAERYRWLRERAWFQDEFEGRYGDSGETVHELDAAIDAAMGDKT